MTAVGSGPAALERLAAALGPGFITTLITGDGHTPRLSVISRDNHAGKRFTPMRVAGSGGRGPNGSPPLMILWLPRTRSLRHCVALLRWESGGERDAGW
jgi:hypothetical protein